MTLTMKEAMGGECFFGSFGSFAIGVGFLCLFALGKERGFKSDGGCRPCDEAGSSFCDFHL